MATITKEIAAKIVAEHGKNAKDSGNAKVQVALLTARINYLTDHFKAHHKDHHSRRGLLKMVSTRRSLLDYVKKIDEARSAARQVEFNLTQKVVDFLGFRTLRMSAVKHFMDGMVPIDEVTGNTASDEL